MPNSTKDGILFLDFDGVLHALGNEPFCKLFTLETWLREHSCINVVISSSWREIYERDEIVGFFAEDLQHRIIGSTPCLISPLGKFWRHAEILAWLKQEDYQGNWIALDDMADAFPDGCEQLIACHPEIGVDAEVLEALSRAVDSWIR